MKCILNDLAILSYHADQSHCVFRSCQHTDSIAVESLSYGRGYQLAHWHSADLVSGWLELTGTCVYVLRPIINVTDNHNVPISLSPVGSVYAMVKCWNMSCVNITVWIVSSSSCTKTVNLRTRRSFGNAIQYRSQRMSKKATFSWILQEMAHKLAPIGFQIVSIVPWSPGPYEHEFIRKAAITRYCVTLFTTDVALRSKTQYAVNCVWQEYLTHSI